MKMRQHRRNRGSIAALAFIGMVPVVAAIGGFAVDTMHFQCEKGALQRATDAAALAGAEDLLRYKGGATSATTIPATEEPLNFALLIARTNVVDGKLVATPASGRTDPLVTASLPTAIAGTPNSNPPASGGTQCRVTATMSIKSIFAQFFGNWSQQMSTNSVAGQTQQQVDTEYSYYPVMVSYTDPGTDPVTGLPAPGLNTLTTGGTFTFTMRQNAIWTIGTSPVNTPALLNAQNGYDNHTPTGEGSLQLAQSVWCDNGTITPCQTNFSTVPLNSIVIMPVTTDTGLGTGPPHNDICSGFVAMRVTNNSVAGTLQGIIVNAVGDGTVIGVSTTSVVPTSQVYAVSLIQ